MTATVATTPRNFGDLLLKVTPPRVPRHVVARRRLLSSTEQLQGRQLILVQAPAGFGKTSLLAQWRREHLGRGTVVAWLSAQAPDDPLRLVQTLALSVRQGAGRPTFGHTLLDTPAHSALEGITTWLAELAHAAMETVLIIDEADRLPADSVELLAYLMRNAPPNLRVVVAERIDLRLGIEDLIDYGQCVMIGPSALRFELDETLDLVRSGFGSCIDRDTAARLHELAEGWPLGLQIALAVLSASPHPLAELATLTARRGTLREQLVGLLLANLDAGDVDFLARVAIVDYLQADLCHAITGSEGSRERLSRLRRDTPIFTVDEDGEWLRMHQLAREALRERFASLPSDEQADLHGRAADWLADHGLLEAAARHMLISGQPEKACEMAERSLYEDLMAHGRQGAVLEWLGRLSPEELDHRPRLLLAAAWTLALSGRHAEGGRLVARIVARPNVDDALRCECALILCGAAIFADDPDRFVSLHDPWAEAPPLRDPMLLQLHANYTAARALLEGDPALARLQQQVVPNGDFGDAHSYAARWGEFVVGLTYLREGQVLLAERRLRPALVLAEADLGRRSPFTCMVAALLAAVLCETDRVTDAAATLANRLDVLEQSGYPEPMMHAYQTTVRIMLADGGEHRALELLEAMYAVGVKRHMPSLCVASLAEQVRLHARRFRSETCRELAKRIDALVADSALARGPLWRRSADLQRNVAHGYAAIAAQEWRRSLDPLTQADAVAQQLKEGRLHVELLGLRALALDRCGENSRALLYEAIDLARTYGLIRVFADAHPALEDLIRQVAPSGADYGASPAALIRTSVEQAPRTRSTPSTALTPKEREVLDLLSRNLSNKEIGLAMQVSEQAIKWHIKNLFAKLDAGTRKQVVLRARILGLLEEGS
jgi:LuxR family maltose regulon positive regulatory protein